MNRLRLAHAIMLVGCLVVGVAAGAENISVSGMGLLQDRQLKRTLLLLLGHEFADDLQIDSVLVEDSAFLLLDLMKSDGYFNPQVRAIVELDDGPVEWVWSGPYSIRMDADVVARRVNFQLSPGLLAYYDSVRMDGLSVMDEREALRYFIPGGVLFPRKSDRPFTPQNLARRSGRLIRQLVDLGYRDAAVAEKSYSIDPDSGAATVYLRIEQGDLHRIRSLTYSGAEGLGVFASEHDMATALDSGVVYTFEWLLDIRQALLNAAYREGHADARVELRATEEFSPQDHVVYHDLIFELDRGPVYQLGGIEFSGTAEMAARTLRRQSQLSSGKVLDVLEVEEARRRLLGLGVFETVEFVYRDAATEQSSRAVEFHLTPRAQRTLELLGGWGSYELWRVGARWTHRNLWHRAHTLTFAGKLSYRASNVALAYSIPQVFGTLTRLSSRAEYSFRAEPTYDLEAVHLAIGTHTNFAASGWMTFVEYQVERQELERIQRSDFLALEDATVASLSLRAVLDRRDNPLYPASGFAFSASLKTASKLLGGQVDFQKLEISGSFHRSISSSVILHAGISFGTLYTWTNNLSNLPFSERFFSGGENSVRSYREGEASPLDSDGRPIGARTRLLAHIELEQRILTRLSVIVFYDAVQFSRDRPFSLDQGPLHGYGVGLRYRTLVGPLRLEYARTIDPRPMDPSGTLHFSIGFPF